MAVIAGSRYHLGQFFHSDQKRLTCIFSCRSGSPAYSFCCLILIALSFLGRLRKRHLWLLLLIGFLGSFIPAFLFAFAETAKVAAPGIGWPLAAIIILGVLGTGVALILFNKLVQMRSAVFASLVTYLIPLIAVFWGLIDGEILDYQHFIGMGAILGGVYVANRL